MNQWFVSFLAEQQSIGQVDQNLFIHLPAGRHLGCVSLGVIMNNVVVNIQVFR